MRTRAWTILLASSIALAASAAAAAAEKGADPFLGDWQGQFTKEGNRRPRPLVAQVIPRGGGRYAIVFREVFDHRCPVYGRAEGRADSGRLVFRGDGFSGEAAGERMTGTGRRHDAHRVEEGRPFALEKVTRLSPRLGAKPPEGAVVLFDGSGFDHWEPDRGDEVTWKIAGGVAHVWPLLTEHAIATGLVTKRAFRDYHLHVEFRLPLLAEATGQTRANSGVAFEDFRWHELQILDSYGLPGYWDECGSIYRFAAPKVNMCAPPGQWQSYDVTYRRPQYGEDGRLLRPARVTVDHNGRVVQNDLELPGGDVPKDRLGSRTLGRIRLQNHGDPIAFRNIWVVEVEGEAAR